MKVEYRSSWQGDMAFQMDIAGHKVLMDAPEGVGGKDQGPRPKPLLLAGLTGCTGMDVVSILKKMKEPIEDFHMDVQADMTEEHPKTYKAIHLVYRFSGRGLTEKNIQKAVRLSREKYCGAIALLEQGASFTYHVEINGQKLAD